MPTRRSLSFVRRPGNAETTNWRDEVRWVISVGIGGLLGFGATLLAIGAVVLLVAGIGGGVLVRERPGTARVLNYDPSDIVLRAAATGGAALLVFAIFMTMYVRLRRAENLRTRIRQRRANPE
ncbi:MAG: hypothetical protein QOF33_1403 [Thermomicrobiales bacterium]|nr:hypothetical protein [Thermomicrobiales bacterium]